MTLLSGVVLMVAIGTVVQNSEQLGRFFKGEPTSPELHADEAEAHANDLAMIDVLANDLALFPDAADRLVITRQPKCGRIFVQGGTVQYLPDGTCFGVQEFSYGLSGTDLEPVSVIVRVGAQKRPTQLATRPEPEKATVPADAAGDMTIAAAPADDTAKKPAVPAQTAETAPEPAPADQPEALARAEDPAPQPEEVARAEAPATPQSRAHADAEPPEVGFGLLEPVDAPEMAAGLGGSDAVEDEPNIPLAVEPWTDLATLTPPLAVPNEDRAGILARSPLPVSRPAEAPVYSPEELALADRLADPTRPDAPAVLRPSAPAILSEPAEEQSRRFALAPVGNEARPGFLKPADQARVEPGEGPGVAAAPERSDTDPLANASSVDMAAPQAPNGSASDDAPSIAELAERNVPGSLGGIRPSMALARIEIPRAGGSLDFVVPQQQPAPVEIEDEPAAETTGPELAALPSATENCVAPAAITLDIGPAAITAIDVFAPCQAGTVALLKYGEFSLALPLGDDGKGRIAVPGFEPSSNAGLTFSDGTEMSFSIPFDGTEKVERVALTWDIPVRLDLHAFEFGARPGDSGHVGPDNARSFADVRRKGGGFMNNFAPVNGKGDHVRVYTHYVRAGSASGIVELALDFADRREAVADACGDGQYAQPGFTVLRMTRGVTERPVRRRLAALDCGDAAGAEMIRNAVKTMVIANR